MLNQRICPFTAKWHKAKLAGCFSDETHRAEFRQELEELQEQLRRYAGLLSSLSGVEDLHGLEDG